MTNEQFQKEIREALNAGQDALDSLKRAEECLSSAGSWGVWDMLGGGFLSTMIKHSRMDDAERELTYAKQALRRLQKELMDVDTISDFHIEVGDFLKFADYFFDGLVADWLVQSKIRDAQRQVADAVQRVQVIINRLHAMQGQNMIE